MENATPHALAENWELLMSFFPADWRKQAQTYGALKGLRQDKSAESYLRVLLLHFGLWFFVARNHRAGAASGSGGSVGRGAAEAFAQEQGLVAAALLLAVCGAALLAGGGGSAPWRLLDGSLVSEPGKTGSQWRIHYSLRWPSLECDYFKLTPVEGSGHGESLHQFPFATGDRVLADRGYCHAEALGEVARQGAFFTVRLNPQGIRLANAGWGSGAAGRSTCRTCRGRPDRRVAGADPPARPAAAAGGATVRGAQDAAAIALAQQKLRRKARKQGWQVQPESLLYAQYVMVLSTFPAAEYSTQRVLEAYRLRWQVELVFKRLKQIAQLGHLPKHDPESSQAWLYGKLLVALLTEKLIHSATPFPPGATSSPGQSAQSLA